MKPQKIDIGQMHEVEFLPSGSVTKKPVCRINGMVCFIDSKNVEEIKAGETWHVCVTKVLERYAIVMPVFISMTAKETEQEKEKLIESFRKEKTQKTKQKKTYVFKSFQELKNAI
jgi:hypothetical protein